MFQGILPADFSTSTIAIAVDLLSNLSPLIILIVSILGAGIILEIILTSHRH